MTLQQFQLDWVQQRLTEDADELSKEQQVEVWYPVVGALPEHEQQRLYDHYVNTPPKTVGLTEQ